MPFAIYPVRYHSIVKKKRLFGAYDSVVDLTDFKRVQAEAKQNALGLSSSLAGGSEGLYDFDSASEIGDEKREPTQVELALRQGRLDRADVDTLRRHEEAKATSEFEASKAESEKKRRSKVDEARQKHLDSQVGFDASAVE